MGRAGDRRVEDRSGHGDTPVGWGAFRFVAGFVIALALGVWLFGDTYDRHFGERRGRDVIRFAHFGTYQDFELWGSVVDEFNAAGRGWNVQQEYVAGMAGHFETKLRQQALIGELPDVAIVQLAFFRENAGLFADLGAMGGASGEELGAEFDAVGVGAFLHEGVQRGLPVSGGPLVVYLNKQCVARASEHLGEALSLPRADWSVAEFQRFAEKLSLDVDGDGVVDQFGFWLPRWVYFLPFVWSEGAAFSNDAGDAWTFRGEGAERAMQLYQQLALTRRVCPREEELPQLFQDTAFLTGRVAMCVNGPWFQPFLAETELRDEYVVLPIPRGAAGSVTRVTWDAVVVARGLAPEREARALSFVERILSEDVQLKIARAGRALPARRSAMRDFAVAEGARAVFTSAQQSGRLQPRWDQFRSVDRTINRYLGLLVNPAEEMTAAEMIERLGRDAVIRAAFQREMGDEH